jgi:alpha-glucosidase
MLSLYRSGLRFRRAAPWEDGAFQWLPSAQSVLAFSRGEFTCFVNFGPGPASLPEGADVLIASDELEGGALPADTTVWLHRPDSSQ